MAPASRGKSDVKPRTRSNRTVVTRKTASAVGSSSKNSTSARIPTMDEVRMNGSQAVASTSSSRSTSATAAARRPKAMPAFEMVVLGSGGGPLETDCSGYLVKPLRSKWEDGVLALEGGESGGKVKNMLIAGSGMGALASLLREQEPKSMFPDVTFPQDYNTPVLKAAYIFSFLT